MAARAPSPRPVALLIIYFLGGGGGGGYQTQSNGISFRTGLHTPPVPTPGILSDHSGAPAQDIGDIYDIWQGERAMKKRGMAYEHYSRVQSDCTLRAQSRGTIRSSRGTLEPGNSEFCLLGWALTS